MAAPKRRNPRPSGGPAKPLGKRGPEHCPNCGRRHGYSLVPASEIGGLSPTSPKQVSDADTHKVFYCDAVFHVVPH